MITKLRRWSGNIRLPRRVKRGKADLMTVTIGALCGVKHTSQTGNIILCADTRITYCSEGVPVTSNDGGSKLFELPMGFYGLIADDVSRSLHVISYLWEEMSRINPEDERRAALIKLALTKTGEYIRMWMRREVLARYGVSLDEFLHDDRLVNRGDICREIEEFSIPTQIIIGGFSTTGSPFLLFADCVNIQEQTNPGFFCGGAGADKALDWLNRRKQNAFMSVQRTAYHIHEAKRFAELSPLVGPFHHILLLRHQKPPANIGTDQPVIERWLRDFYPRSTDVLDQDAAWQEFSGEYAIGA